MKFFKRKIIASAILSALVLPSTAFATNGMHGIGNGTKAQGMGGAGAALSDENGSIVTNPAAVVGVGDQLDVSLTLFTPSPRSYEIKDNLAFDPSGNLLQGSFDANEKSLNDLFLIPFFGISFPINKKICIGI